MSGVAEQRGAARGLSSRRRASAVIMALTAAVAFGAIDQYLGTLSSWSLAEVSGMSAPWLLLPFLAGPGRQGSGARQSWAWLPPGWPFWHMWP
jgi:hypothetical protein